MCQVKHRLGQACSLNDTPDFDRAFVFDEFSNGVDQIRGEL